MKRVKTLAQLRKHPMVSGVTKEYQYGVFDESDYIWIVMLIDGKQFKYNGTIALYERSAQSLIDCFNGEEVIDEQ